MFHAVLHRITINMTESSRHFAYMLEAFRIYVDSLQASITCCPISYTQLPEVIRIMRTYEP